MAVCTIATGALILMSQLKERGHTVRPPPSHFPSTFLLIPPTVYADDTLIREGGISMAAPSVASVINLLNKERLTAGKATLGFVNLTF